MTKSTTDKLKIGFVLDDGLDKPDGVQQYILTLGEWLISQGHEVRYLVGESGRTDIKEIIPLSKNIKVHFNGNSLSVPLYPKISKIKRTLREEKFDVLHVQVPYSPVMGAQVVRYGAKHSVIIGTFHILPLTKLHLIGSQLLAITLRMNLKHFDKQLSVSIPARNFAKETYKIDSEVLGNPIKLPTLSKSIIEVNEKFTISFLGRLVPRKGCLTLLKAISELREKGKRNIKVNIGGSGKQKRSLEKYVADNNLQDYVEFYGFIEEDNKIAFLRNSNLAVFPSKGGESFGIVLLEAMASKRPLVLAGDNLGYRSVMIGNEDSLFDSNNHHELRKLIEKYMDSPSKIKLIYGKQQRIVENFDVDNIGKKLLSVYIHELKLKRRD